MLSILAIILLFAGTSLRGETPTQAVDRVWNAFMSRDPKQSDEAFSDSQMCLVEQIVREQGVAVIPPIMARAKSWKGEEVLVFVGLVCSLPPSQSTPILERYQKSGEPWERRCATDLLIEVNDLSISHETKTVHATETLPK